MTEINLQKKKSNIWPWIIGLLVLALVVWGVSEMLGSDDDIDDIDETAVVDPAPAVLPGPPAADTEAPITVASIVATPASFAGQEVTGTATVADVISDRGFWIEQDGQRIFAIIDEPVPETIHISTGQTVHLTGTVYTSADDLSAPIEADAQAQIKDQPAFLYVKAADIRITERPS